MALVQHDVDLWSSEHQFGWQGGLISIPVRMTVIRLADKRLILHSPVPISPKLREELDALGPVGFIVVPEAHGLQWDFQRILPGHGDVIEHGGPAALRAAWLR
jgi:hypothetical protein